MCQGYICNHAPAAEPLLPPSTSSTSTSFSLLPRAAPPLPQEPTRRLTMNLLWIPLLFLFAKPSNCVEGVSRFCERAGVRKKEILVQIKQRGTEMPGVEESRATGGLREKQRQCGDIHTYVLLWSCVMSREMEPAGTYNTRLLQCSALSHEMRLEVYNLPVVVYKTTFFGLLYAYRHQREESFEPRARLPRSTCSYVYIILSLASAVCYSMANLAPESLIAWCWR